MVVETETKHVRVSPAFIWLAVQANGGLCHGCVYNRGFFVYITAETGGPDQAKVRGACVAHDCGLTKPRHDSCDHLKRFRLSRAVRESANTAIPVRVKVA